MLSACVDASDQGSIEVRPGPVEICVEHGDLPYTGPTDEQLRYAAFLEEVDVLEAREQPRANPAPATTISGRPWTPSSPGTR